MDLALQELSGGPPVRLTPVLAPRTEKPAAIAHPAEWRVVGVRRHNSAVELLVAPRTLDALKP